MSDVRIFKPADFNLKAESMSTMMNARTGEDERWMKLRFTEAPKPRAEYEAIKGMYYILGTTVQLFVIGAVLVDERVCVTVRLDMASGEQQELFNAFINEEAEKTLTVDDKVLRERMHIAEQLGGLGNLFIRAAELLADDIDKELKTKETDDGRN